METKNQKPSPDDEFCQMSKTNCVVDKFCHKFLLGNLKSEIGSVAKVQWNDYDKIWQRPNAIMEWDAQDV